MSAVDKATLLKGMRDKRARDMTAQAAAHRLIELIFEPNQADLHWMRDAKEELEHIVYAIKGASVEAAVVGKIMTIQIQFAQCDHQEIQLECVAEKWVLKIEAFERECAVRKICLTQFFLHCAVSADKARKLETHAQQSCIAMCSRDPNDTICQCYCAASLSALNMSVLNIGAIFVGSPRITINLYEAHPSRAVEPCDSRTDAVFGEHPTEVCFAMLDCMHVYEHQILILMYERSGTDKTVQGHAFDGDQQYHPRDQECRPHKHHCR